ncbi:glycosyltransferase [Vibrio cholerae]|nr:glycosyltransferase [Vibrio cholerae]
MPARILDRHVGGNTTYARALETNLQTLGHSVSRIPAGKNPLTTMLMESVHGLRKGRSDEVLHYVADTGPLIRGVNPSVLTVHGIASRWIDNGRSTAEERIWRTRVQAAIRSTDELITVSHSSANDIASVFNLYGRTITVIPHGIDSGLFHETCHISESVQNKLPTENFVLYVGNIEPRKNLLELIAAFGSPEIIELGIILVIAGKPAWHHSEILREASKANNVIYLGFVSSADRIALMQACQLFVFPSLYEGFGFPVLEALAAGAVVVCSDRGSLEEVSGPALRFESLDRNGLRDGIVLALSDTNRRYSCQREGKLWADRFSWRKSTSEHIGVYQRAIEDH